MFLFKNQQKKDHLNILIVDDNAVMLEILEEFTLEYFKNNDIKEFTINKFSSVHDFSERNKLVYDISLIDWNIGKEKSEKGSAVVRRIKDTCSNISIVSGQVNDMIKIAKFSIDEGILYIRKTNNETLLKEKIFNFLEDSVKRLK